MDSTRLEFGDLTSQTDALGRTSSYTYNALGRTTSYTYNASGEKITMVEPIPAGSSAAATTTYQYDAFGNEVNSTGTTQNNHLYRGEQWDPDLGLYYLRARYYNPLTGRFMSRDPLERVQQMVRSVYPILASGRKESTPLKNLPQNAPNSSTEASVSY